MRTIVFTVLILFQPPVFSEEAVSTLSEAVEQVKKKDRGGQVISAYAEKTNDGRVFYRIRFLKKNGSVKLYKIPFKSMIGDKGWRYRGDEKFPDNVKNIDSRRAEMKRNKRDYVDSDERPATNRKRSNKREDNR